MPRPIITEWYNALFQKQLNAVLDYLDGVFGGLAPIATSGSASDLTTGTIPAARIANDTVTYAKMQNVSAASRLLGRGSAGGAGDPEEISLGAGLTMTGTVLSGASWLEYRPNAAIAGANVTTAQNVFDLNVTLDASTVYEYELIYSLTKSAGATSHTVSALFGGTATINNIHRNLLWAGGTGTTAGSVISAYGASTSAIVATGSVATAGFNFWSREVGTVSINGGGTFIPQYQLSAAPGGAYSTNTGSYFKLRRLGPAGVINVGGWT